MEQATTAPLTELAVLIVSDVCISPSISSPSTTTS